jgi:hypothetical protein
VTHTVNGPAEPLAAPIAALSAFSDSLATGRSSLVGAVGHPCVAEAITSREHRQMSKGVVRHPAGNACSKPQALRPARLPPGMEGGSAAFRRPGDALDLGGAPWRSGRALLLSGGGRLWNDCRLRQRSGTLTGTRGHTGSRPSVASASGLAGGSSDVTRAATPMLLAPSGRRMCAVNSCSSVATGSGQAREFGCHRRASRIWFDAWSQITEVRWSPGLIDYRGSCCVDYIVRLDIFNAICEALACAQPLPCSQQDGVAFARGAARRALSNNKDGRPGGACNDPAFPALEGYWSICSRRCRRFSSAILFSNRTLAWAGRQPTVDITVA